MTTETDSRMLSEEVMTGLERLFEGNGDYVSDNLSEEASNLVLIISARTMAKFCDDNEGRHEAWGTDEATWAQWIAHCRGLVAETEKMLGPWFVAWINGKV